MIANPLTPKLTNPLKEQHVQTHENQADVYSGLSERSLAISERDKTIASPANIVRQHEKNRFTVWERIDRFFDSPPHILHRNWGSNLDGDSLVSAIGTVNGRRVAFYGHDFTVRAGSITAENGSKLAHLVEQAAKLRIPLIGMNDSAGAYVPAGVGGLDGYAQAFTALRKISGVVPSIMCMFGFNAGGGSYLPRQGSFLIQPKQTFFGLTGPAVVKSVLGEEVSADDLGGPNVHSASGVVDFVAEDEADAIEQTRSILEYLPDSSDVIPRRVSSSDPLDRASSRVTRLLQHTFATPTGINTPMDIRVIIEELCDHGDYLETQATRAGNSVTALGRVDGYVTGFVANNSIVQSGQIDVAAAYKKARFIRFCNLYNIPLIFLEDTTGFLPGQKQEADGIVHAGRAMLDAIIDIRTPRFLLIVRNAYGGAYASYNNYSTGADLVVALPCARVAVMGPAGVEFVYKKELRDIVSKAKAMQPEDKKSATQWLNKKKAELNTRYERELMNPDKALALGSISRIIQPDDTRRMLGTELSVRMRSYQPKRMTDTQREFH